MAKIKAIINTNGRQPIYKVVGSGLNANGYAKVKGVPRVINPLQRKPR